MGVHFLIRSIGHKKRELRPGDTLTIGRDASNDMVFNDGTVCPTHAVVRWDSDQAFPLVEVKSPQGVEVNDDFCEDAAFITDYTTLGVGDFAVIFQPKGKKKSERLPVQAPPAESKGGFRLFSEDTTRMKGSFTSCKGLHDALRLVEEKKRTGTLEVKADGKTSKVIFGFGILVTAEHGDASGREAVDAIVAIESGEFFFSPEIEPSEDNLGLSIKQLLDG